MEISPLKRILSWIATIIHLLLFFCIILFFHCVYLIGYLLLGQRVFNGPLNLKVRLITLNLITAGVRFRVVGRQNIPENSPCIIVSNHQCMYDISSIIHLCAHLRPRFISKIELAKGIPAISHALKKGKHLVINRSDKKSSLQAIREWGEKMYSDGQSVCIFPEGTRSRDGRLRPFKLGGFQTLTETMPGVPVLPMSIDGMWELMKYKFWPIPFGCEVTVRFHPVIEGPIENPKATLKEIETLLGNDLVNVDTSSGKS